jgi:hypothetical protein
MGRFSEETKKDLSLLQHQRQPGALKRRFFALLDLASEGVGVGQMLFQLDLSVTPTAG